MRSGIKRVKNFVSKVGHQITWFFGRSIRTQILLLFAVIFAMNAAVIAVLLNGSYQNSLSVKNSQKKVTQCQEISAIIADHVNWVNDLGNYIGSYTGRGAEYKGNLDEANCPLRVWLNSLDNELMNDPDIVAAIARLEAPHTVLHSRANSIIDLVKRDTEKANDQYQKYILTYLMSIIKELNSISDRYNQLAIESTVSSAEVLEANSIIQIAMIGLVLLMSVIIALFVIKISVKPAVKITKATEMLAKGELDVQIDIKSKNEMGRMTESLNRAISSIKSYIRDITDKLEQMSRGDMQINVDMEYIGDFAAIKQAIQNTAAALNQTLTIIHTAAEQVSTGASQVAMGAQALAAGSTEQASAVEELSASIEAIAGQAAENSANVKMATQYMDQATADVRDGSEHMKRLTEAMENIGTASSQIASITKMIEDIAFQTNILALNAAIEAARAGSAGKGFAVVADEVRNLAAKSAEAAKQTAELIRRSAATVAEGTQITGQTAQILKNIEERASLVERSVAKIDQASMEQASTLEQIKQGLKQVSAVVQTNAATAEENSATSEEMSAQAVTLLEEVGKFKLDSGCVKDNPAPISLIQEPTMTDEPAYAASSLGKY